MGFTCLAVRRTSNLLLFLLNKRDGHCSRISSCNFFLTRHPFYSTATTSSESDDHTVDSSSSLSSSPTISYLNKKCGLSAKSALSVSKKFELKFPEKSDSVLQVLRNHGFTNKHITDLIIKYPYILSYQVEKNLKPKLEFFLSEGYTHPQIVDLVLSNSFVLLRISLERKIIPSITFMKTVLPSNTAVIRFLKLTSHVSIPLWKTNIESLRSVGGPESIIKYMFTLWPTCMSRNPKCFAKGVAKTLDLGFKPSRVLLFVRALGMLLSIKPSTWERKMMLYRSLGLSNEEALLLFKNSPQCFGLSDKLIKKKMDFLIQKLRISPSRVVSYPDFLRSSLEKKMIPRYAVLSVLVANGLIKTAYLYNFKISVANFSVRFVDRFKDEVPEVVEAYKGNLNFEGAFQTSNFLVE